MAKAVSVTRGPERILDEYLVASAKAGDGRALDQLVRRWTPRLLRYAVRKLGAVEPARDIVQDTWISAIRNLPALSDPARFPPWLYSIATHKCADAIRKAVRARRRDASIVEEATVNGAAIDPAGVAAERLDIGAALAGLSPDHRIVVDLFYSDDLSVEEIADAVGIPAGTVKSRLHHARQVLRQHLGETES
jgi:RNA polymerase sigma-70 factor, ECF subfamily